MEDKNNQEPVEIPEESLEDVAGGAGTLIYTRDLDDFVYPLFKQGLTDDQVYEKLIEAGKIKRYVNYFVADAGYDFPHYLQDIYTNMNVPDYRYTMDW